MNVSCPLCSSALALQEKYFLPASQISSTNNSILLLPRDFSPLISQVDKHVRHLVLQCLKKRKEKPYFRQFFPFPSLITVELIISCYLSQQKNMHPSHKSIPTFPTPGPKAAQNSPCLRKPLCSQGQAVHWDIRTKRRSHGISQAHTHPQAEFSPCLAFCRLYLKFPTSHIQWVWELAPEQENSASSITFHLHEVRKLYTRIGGS